MYDQRQYNAWMIDLANHFVRNENYQIISMSKHQNEMWLVNIERKEKPFLLITSLAIEELDQAMIAKHRQALGIIFKVAPQGVNISVCQDSKALDDENVLVGPDYISSSRWLEDFSGLDQLLVESKNPKRSENKSISSLRRTVRKAQKQAQRRLTPVTMAVGTILVLVYLLANFLMAQGRRPEVVAIMLGAYYKAFIVQGLQFFRMLTSGFLHLDFFHLIMNMIALRNLGMIMERRLGSKRFLITLLSGIFFGNVFVFILNDASIGLGISGGLFALLGAMFVYLYESGAFKNPRVLSRVFSIIVINVLISSLPEVSGAAHLGGFQAGIFLGFIFSKRPDWKQVRQAVKLLFSLMILALLLLMIKNRDFESLAVLDREVVNAWYELGFKSYANWLQARLLR